MDGLCFSVGLWCEILLSFMRKIVGVKYTCRSRVRCLEGIPVIVIRRRMLLLLTPQKMRRYN